MTDRGETLLLSKCILVMICWEFHFSKITYVIKLHNKSVCKENAFIYWIIPTKIISDDLFYQDKLVID